MIVKVKGDSFPVFIVFESLSSDFNTAKMHLNDELFVRGMFMKKENYFFDSVGNRKLALWLMMSFGKYRSDIFWLPWFFVFVSLTVNHTSTHDSTYPEYGRWHQACGDYRVIWHKWAIWGWRSPQSQVKPQTIRPSKM